MNVATKSGKEMTETENTLVVGNCPTCNAFPVQIIGESISREHRFVQTNGLSVDDGHVQKTEDGLITITDGGRGATKSTKEWLDLND
jgi:hypothetical protein